MYKCHRQIRRPEMFLKSVVEFLILLSTFCTNLVGDKRLSVRVWLELSVGINLA